MRYKNGETTVLVGKLPTGKSVNIMLVNIATDEEILLTDSVCLESLHIPGAYTWNTEKIDEVFSTQVDCLYEMRTAGGVAFQGKIVLGGYLDDIATDTKVEELKATVSNIPTTDYIGSFDVVTNAIADLNDVSVAEIRSGFNDTEFKNNEEEFHNWLDNYTNKGAWKESANTTSITSKLDAIKVAVDGIRLDVTSFDNNSLNDVYAKLSAVEGIVNNISTDSKFKSLE